MLPLEIVRWCPNSEGAPKRTPLAQHKIIKLANHNMTPEMDSFKERLLFHAIIELIKTADSPYAPCVGRTQIANDPKAEHMKWSGRELNAPIRISATRMASERMIEYRMVSSNTSCEARSKVHNAGQSTIKHITAKPIRVLPSLINLRPVLAEKNASSANANPNTILSGIG